MLSRSGLCRMTLACTTTAPEESETVPPSSAVCPNADTEENKKAPATMTTILKKQFLWASKVFEQPGVGSVFQIGKSNALPIRRD